MYKIKTGRRQALALRMQIRNIAKISNSVIARPVRKLVVAICSFQLLHRLNDTEGLPRSLRNLAITRMEELL